ncbi:MAG: hypothetical protein D6809_05795 [Gammaproteobacteria bacterium]|nr:MAG: hypothetical protein D6809_05795 [Gammaproteobacteria bacterium]
MRDQAARRAARARDRAVSMAMKRKEEYLGARVPRELKEKVARRAKELGIPISILIRNVLEGAFGEAGSGMGPGMTASSPATVAAAAPLGAGEAAEPAGPDGGRFPSVLGWEEIRLNRRVSCAGCGRELQPGEQATLGIGLPGEGHVILCPSCKETV